MTPAELARDDANASPAPALTAAEAARIADYIASVQRADGAIPHVPRGPIDVWNHVEAAMGLDVAGRHGEAERAYLWLAGHELEDGGWWALYDPSGAPEETYKDTNFVAYVATGVWHHYLATGDSAFAVHLWPVVERAIDLVVSHQLDEGEVAWAVAASGEPYEDALITGASSTAKSLDCGLALARLAGRSKPEWREARDRLGNAIRTRPDRFDRTWTPKSDHAMDWFYPVLTGVLAGTGAADRLARDWPVFVAEGRGCRCVSDRPWITVAETAELVIALSAAGFASRAREVFSWVHQWRHEDGSYWTGVVFPETVFWPEERPTWTAGAVLLAHDVLDGVSGAAGLFGDGVPVSAAP